MSTGERITRTAITWIVTVLVPMALMLSSIRLIINQTYLQVEYHMPNFPADPYGLTLQDRLKWAPYAVDYLVNDAGINYLGDLKFPDGTPMYNERELSHMVDVKKLVQLSFKVWDVSLGLLVGLGLAAWGAKWSLEYRRGLSYGGWLTVGILVLILAGVFINFDELFTEFHRLFFTGNSWLFYFSDTLIRLFPMRFWQDAFILFGVICMAGGGLLGYFFGRSVKQG
jgi:integral membrane protein (TIGR01906 family)